MSKTCIGCGMGLQSDFPDKVGYIPLEKNVGQAYCERCFRLIHYNEGGITPLSYNNEEILKLLNKDKNYVFFLVDFLNINEEVMETFHKIKTSKCLLISKTDILPKSISYEKIKMFLNNVYHVKTPIYFMSSKRRYGIKSIFKEMDVNKIKQAFLVGYTNAGKSTLLNTLKEENTITVSILPNTTLGMIENHIEGYTLYDTPGFTYRAPFYQAFSSLYFKKMELKKPLNPITYQLKKETSLLLEDFLRIENVGEKNSFTIYMSGSFKWKQVFLGNSILKDKKETVLEIPSNSDLILPGLGFINIKKKCKVHLYSDYEDFSVRTSIFGGSYE